MELCGEALYTMWSNKTYKCNVKIKRIQYSWGDPGDDETCHHYNKITKHQQLQQKRAEMTSTDTAALNNKSSMTTDNAEKQDTWSNKGNKQMKHVYVFTLVFLVLLNLRTIFSRACSVAPGIKMLILSTTSRHK